MSGFGMGIDGLGDNADVGDTGLLDRVHHGGKSAKRNVFVGADENRLVARIADALLQSGSDLVDVDWVVAEIDLLRFVDADDQALFSNFLHRARVGHVDFDARLKDRSRDHEDNEEYQNNVNQRRDVNVRQSRLRASVGGGKRHQRATSAACGACWRSTRLSISSVKSSLRAANSRIELLIRL